MNRRNFQHQGASQTEFLPPQEQYLNNNGYMPQQTYPVNHEMIFDNKNPNTMMMNNYINQYQHQLEGSFQNNRNDNMNINNSNATPLRQQSLYNNYEQKFKNHPTPPSKNKNFPSSPMTSSPSNVLNNKTRRSMVEHSEGLNMTNENISYLTIDDIENMSNSEKTLKFYYAAKHSNINKVRIFLQYGININYQNWNDKGNTALHNASYHGDVNLVNLLLWAGSDITITNKHGETCLHRAVCNQKGSYVIPILLDHGCDINARTNTGNTPLMWAAWHGRIELVQLLLERNADVFLMNNKSETALIRATKSLKSGTNEVVTILTDYMHQIQQEELQQKQQQKLLEKQQLKEQQLKEQQLKEKQLKEQQLKSKKNKNKKMNKNDNNDNDDNDDINDDDNINNKDDSISPPSPTDNINIKENNEELLNKTKNIKRIVPRKIIKKKKKKKKLKYSINDLHTNTISKSNNNNNNTNDNNDLTFQIKELQIENTNLRNRLQSEKNEYNKQRQIMIKNNQKELNEQRKKFETDMKKQYDQLAKLVGKVTESDINHLQNQIYLIKEEINDLKLLIENNINTIEENNETYTDNEIEKLKNYIINTKKEQEDIYEEQFKIQTEETNRLNNEFEKLKRMNIQNSRKIEENSNKKNVSNGISKNQMKIFKDLFNSLSTDLNRLKFKIDEVQNNQENEQQSLQGIIDHSRMVIDEKLKILENDDSDYESDDDNDNQLFNFLATINLENYYQGIKQYVGGYEELVAFDLTKIMKALMRCKMNDDDQDILIGALRQRRESRATHLFSQDQSLDEENRKVARRRSVQKMTSFKNK